MTPYCNPPQAFPLAATTPQPFAHEIILIFAIIRIIFRWREPDGPKTGTSFGEILQNSTRGGASPGGNEACRRQLGGILGETLHMAFVQNKAMAIRAMKWVMEMTME